MPIFIRIRVSAKDERATPYLRPGKLNHRPVQAGPPAWQAETPLVCYRRFRLKLIRQPAFTISFSVSVMGEMNREIFRGSPPPLMT